MLWCCCVALCLSTVITTATVSNATPSYNVYFNNLFDPPLRQTHSAYAHISGLIANKIILVHCRTEPVKCSAAAIRTLAALAGT